MGWIEDSVEEFRKLPTPGKIAVGGAAVGVAILAYAHYRSSSGSSGATTSPAATTDSGLSGLGVPSLASSPADWANWFSQGLTIPTQTSDGAPVSVTTPDTSSNPVATFTAPAGAVAAAATSTATASAHIATSASAPAPAPLPNIQNPTAAQTLAHIAGPIPTAPIPTAPIQNPTVAQTAAHVGRLAPVNPSFIPTTIRPLPTPGRGRVA